jgi:hypothetical protein
MNIVVGQYYVRRRDKVLVRVDKKTGQNVEYCTVFELTVHTVSANWFRQGFRMPTEGELKHLPKRDA